MHQHTKWEEYLPLVEFVYNNGYQELLEDWIMWKVGTSVL